MQQSYSKNSLSQVEAIMQHTNCAVADKFLSIFQGLGNFGERYTIKLKPGEKPHAIYTPRHVAMPLCSEVKQELDHMESMNVISKVEEPTSWCAGMVVVKKTGTIRVCVDLKSLNKSAQHEVHPIPAVDDTLAQMRLVQKFSVPLMPIVGLAGPFGTFLQVTYNIPRHLRALLL